MVTKTVANYADLGATPAAGDLIPIWDTSEGEYKHVEYDDLIGDGGTITGGGVVATGGFTFTIPATGTAALLAATNVFTANQRVNALLGVNAAPTTDAQVLIESGAAARNALRLRSAASQSGPVFQVDDNAGNFIYGLYEIGILERSPDGLASSTFRQNILLPSVASTETLQIDITNNFGSVHMLRSTIAVNCSRSGNAGVWMCAQGAVTYTPGTAIRIDNLDFAASHANTANVAWVSGGIRITMTGVANTCDRNSLFIETTGHTANQTLASVSVFTT